MDESLTKSVPCGGKVKILGLGVPHGYTHATDRELAELIKHFAKYFLQL
jgi:hypothetical protein